MTLTQRDAAAMFNELQKNPGGFAHMAKNDPRSHDEATKAVGGQMELPLTRHAHPRNVSDAAFEQLLDGDPNDKDPSHKPQDGAITGRSRWPRTRGS
jgi:foldase protein PrsA